MKMQNVVRLNAPLKLEIEVSCRYDKEWDCHFLSILVGEIAPGREKPIFEEVIICLNNKAELDKFKGLIEKVTKKVKK